MSKTFPQESFEAFFNSKSLHCAEQKKRYQRVLAECFEKQYEKRHGFICFFKKETFWHSPTYFKYAYGFHNETSGTTVQR